MINIPLRDIVIKRIEEKDAKENELEALKEKQTKVETSLNNLSAQQEEMKRELNELNGQQKEMINILTAMTKKLADLTKKLPTKEDKMWFQLYFFHSGKLFMSQPKWYHFYAIQINYIYGYANNECSSSILTPPAIMILETTRW